MRALVTGGTGFVGQHLAAALLAEGYEVRVLDLHPPERGVDPALELLRGDVRDADAIRHAAAGCDVLVDNAVLPPVTRASAADYMAVNAGGCRNVLDAARVEGSYVLHVSSSSIYGVPAELPVTEATPLRPFEPYGRSKAEAERFVATARENGQAVASLRSRALLGRGRLGLFELIFRRIRAGKRVPLFGRGDALVQMCDVGDFCAAAAAAIRLRASGDYNIGSAGFGTVREDLESLIAHAGTRARLQPVPIWAIRAVLQPLAALGRSPFGRWHWVSAGTSFHADLSKARSELGWEPRRTNAEALAAAYDGWLAEPDDVGESPHRRPLEGALARLLRG